HAYQDDTKAEYHNNSDEEADAIKFENYIRDVLFGADGRGHRTKHSGITVVHGATAFDSNGERVDLGSINITKLITGEQKESQLNTETIQRDNTTININTIDVSYILEHMGRNGIEKLSFRLDQQKKLHQDEKTLTVYFNYYCTCRDMLFNC
ncbi:MAG: hypothetical protein R2795_15350, partial [Saprospiraceae bacterium]